MLDELAVKQRFNPAKALVGLHGDGATKDDFEKDKRKTLMSRIATGNWDAVIVTHPGFEKIPLARETQEEFFKEQLRELALAVDGRKEKRGNPQTDLAATPAQSSVVAVDMAVWLPVSLPPFLPKPVAPHPTPMLSPVGL